MSYERMNRCYVYNAFTEDNESDSDGKPLHTNRETSRQVTTLLHDLTHKLQRVNMVS